MDVRIFYTTLAVAVIAGALQAQNDEIPKGERLKGKVGPALESHAEIDLRPRTLKLDRLQISDEVRDAFLAKLSEEKDEVKLERLRQMKIDRMKRKLGTSRAEALAIRDDFEIEGPAKKKPVARAAEPEDTSIRDLCGIFLVLASTFGYLIWRFRR